MGKLPSIIYKNQPEYLRKENLDTSNRDRMIYQFETTSPYDFINSKSSLLSFLVKYYMRDSLSIL